MSTQFKVFLLVLALIMASTYLYKKIQASSETRMMGGSKTALNL